ncbi:coth protein-domain-containing protein [Parasitella parasitica]|nr:coth protein-domain-containing protein [Parasitella parasitica]
MLQVLNELKDPTLLKMQLFSAIALTLISVAFVTASPNATYKVLSLVPDNQTLAVIVDEHVYPLTITSRHSSLLHTGEAPTATSCYCYAILEKSNQSNVIERENFTRSPVAKDDTLNEFYGRPWNSMNLAQLPRILEPLPIINRIDSKLHIDGEIPTMHFTGNQTAIDYIHANQHLDIDVEGLNMTYISPNDIQTFKDVTFAIAGMSTRYLDKVSYKIKIPKDNDLYHYRRLKLRAMGTDMSYMREKLVSEIADSVGLPTTKFSYVRVFINDQAVGLFGLAENFKTPWVRNEFNNGEKSSNQGALYVCDLNGKLNETTSTGNLTNTTVLSDLSYFSDNATLYSIPYPVKEEPATGTANYTRIMDFTKFLSEQSTNVSDSVIPLWEERIDVASFLRGLAFEVVVSSIDGYLGLHNNYILYDDLKHERLVFSTAYGHPAEFMGGNYTEFPGLNSTPLATRLLAVPKFKAEFDNLIRNYTTGIVNTDTMNPRIDDLMAFLKDDVAWDKSLPRLGSYGYGAYNPGNLSASDIPFSIGVNGPIPGNMTMGVREWLVTRSNSLEEYFNQTSVLNS